ncbi:MAG: hypothetical protein ACUVQ0_04500 [Thermoproteota archaeon]
MDEPSSFPAVFHDPPIVPVFIFVPLVAFLLVKYHVWAAGAEGGENVVEVLSSLKGFETVNDIVLPREKANIVHVVLSAKGFS